MKSNPGQNLMDDFEGNYWWNSVGTISSFQGTLPGPVKKDGKHIVVKKKELFVYTYPEGKETCQKLSLRYLKFLMPETCFCHFSLACFANFFRVFKR